MSLTYATFTTSVANFLVIPITNPDLIAAFPNIIDDAEQRLYRDLDLLNTVVGVNGAAAAPSNAFTIPVPGGGGGPILVTQDVRVEVPGVGFVPLLPVSKAFIDTMYPNAASAGAPIYFAMLTQAIILFGPWPDQDYPVNVTGTIRPNPLSATNQTTLLSLYFPDLFLNAALAIGAGYMKNFGAATDDPQSGVSWETKYQTQLKSATLEEARKKFQDQGWISQSTGPQATPPRT